MEVPEFLKEIANAFGSIPGYADAIPTRRWRPLSASQARRRSRVATLPITIGRALGLLMAGLSPNTNHFSPFTFHPHPLVVDP